MKVLIYGYLHHKNKHGLIMMLNHLGYEYVCTNDINHIKNSDVVYSAAVPFDTSKYPNAFFIFGPQFSVFPDHKLQMLNIHCKNWIYIQPSNWAVEIWKLFDVKIPLKPFPFPVDTNTFCPSLKDKTKVVLYMKSRHPEEMKIVTSFLNARKISYRIFDYDRKYQESEFLKYLKESKYGIFLGRHESQGFALEECLSCNVPLLVWNVRFMSQEYGSNYNNYDATSIPYWDDRCGEYFYDAHELEKTFELFISKLDTYKPREYIMEHLSVEPCVQRFKNYLGNK